MPNRCLCGRGCPRVRATSAGSSANRGHPAAPAPFPAPRPCSRGRLRDRLLLAVRTGKGSPRKCPLQAWLHPVPIRRSSCCTARTEPHTHIVPCLGVPEGGVAAQRSRRLGPWAPVPGRSVEADREPGGLASSKCLWACVCAWGRPGAPSHEEEGLQGEGEKGPWGRPIPQLSQLHPALQCPPRPAGMQPGPWTLSSLHPPDMSSGVLSSSAGASGRQGGQARAGLLLAAGKVSWASAARVSAHEPKAGPVEVTCPAQDHLEFSTGIGGKSESSPRYWDYFGDYFECACAHLVSSAAGAPASSCLPTV